MTVTVTLILLRVYYSVVRVSTEILKFAFIEFERESMINGTVVAAGDNTYGQCNESGWNLGTPCPLEDIYGEPSKETAGLRNLCDNALSQTPEGQELIRLYYQLSPAIVEAMEEDEEFRKEIKEMMDDFLLLITKEIE